MTPRRLRLPLAILAGAALLAATGCSEKPQDREHRGRLGQATAYAANPGPFHAPDWAGGDREAWTAQLHKRAERQNEYVRTGATAGGMVATAIAPPPPPASR